MLLAIWSRTWIGWWSLVPIATARGIYGERAWLEDRDLVSPDHRRILHLLLALGIIGLSLMVWGLVLLPMWPTVFGTTLVVVAQLWRIDRFGRPWERHRAHRS